MPTTGLHAPTRLHVAHFNHQLRPEADDDARFVAATAAALGVTFHPGSGDVAALAQGSGLGTEAAARRLRYAFLAQTALACGARFVLTGHQRDDQAETVLLHLLRGSGLAGLRGMQPLTPLGPLVGMPQAELWLGRPLLDLSGADLRAYCADHGLQPRQDASNADPLFLRNRIRGSLLPLLAEMNPQIDRRLAALAAQVAADADLLAEGQAAALAAVTAGAGPGWLRLDLHAWRGLHLSRRRALLRLAWTAVTPADAPELTFDTIEAACRLGETGAVGGQAVLPAGVTVTVTYEALAFAAPGVRPPAAWPQLAGGAPLGLSVPGRVALAEGWVLTAELSASGWEEATANSDPFVAYLRCDIAALTVRARRAGDRFRPQGMVTGSKSLKDTYREQRIPAAARDGWPLVVCGDEIAWVTGRQVGAIAAVEPGGAANVRLSCRPPAGDR